VLTAENPENLHRSRGQRGRGGVRTQPDPIQAERPDLAEKLSRRSYPIAAKRMCVDIGYYEVYNQDNVC